MTLAVHIGAAPTAIWQIHVDPCKAETLRQRDAKGTCLRRVGPYLWHSSQALQALQALPHVATTVCRGMDATNLAEYQQSKCVHWSGFSSTSTNAEVSTRPPFYHGPPGVVLG